MKNIVQRLFVSVAAFLAAQSFGAVLIPPSDISPVQSGVVLGRTSTGSGRAEQLTAGDGIVIANGQISAPGGGGGGGAPTTATYITQTPNATLSAEQPLSLLSSGILFSTTTTGVITSTGTSATGNALISGGSGAIPTWGKIGLATHVSGNLPVANLNSGTGASSTTFWAGDGTWKVPGGGGNVTVSGTPTSGQLAEWTSATNIQGLAATGTGSAVRATSPAFQTNIRLAGSAAPSTSTVGDTAYDTNAWAGSRGAAQIFDGTSNTFVVAALSSDTPSNGDVPTWNTGGTITWEPSASGATAVTAAATFGTDNIVLRSDGTSRGAQASPVSISDAGDITGVGNMTVANLTTTDLTISGTITGVMGVTNGGTGRATGTTAYSLVATGTTATGAQQTLANGATTTVLVGGGASALPVWTTATGTGAPVRAGSPIFTGNITMASGTAPTTTVAGDTAFDTNAQGAGRGSIQVFDGTANTYVAAALASDTPTNGQVLTWNTGGTMTWETATSSQFLPWFDVVGSYNGSGSATTTTGSISATTPTITVASASTFVVGQGILIKGAGTAGAHHVSTISTIVGTTITIANNAITTVAGAVVQHDDTVAINAALAAAYNAGGGRVLLRSGTYRTNAPRNGTTNSILTLPQDQTYVGVPVRVEFLGEAKGNLSANVGGVYIDALDAAAGSGTDPAVFAGAPTLDGTNLANWLNVDVFIDRIYMKLPANPTLSGINANSMLRFSCGDALAIVTETVSGDFVEPTNASYGIIWPMINNNIGLDCGAAHIAGFRTGMKAGEHMLMRRPIIAFTQFGVEFPGQNHLISGSICIEKVPTFIHSTGARAVVNLELQLEWEEITSGRWWAGVTGSDIIDSSNTLFGRIKYAMIGTPSAGPRAMSVTGATNVTLEDLWEPPATTPGATPPVPSILHWELNDGSGTAIVASVGSNGTTNASWVTGQDGTGFALDFNGTSSVAGSNSNIIPGSSGIITVAGWFFLDDLAATQILWESSANEEFSAGTFNAFLLGGAMFVHSHGVIAQSYGVTLTPPSTGVWTHITATMDVSVNPGTIRIWFNGVEQSTTTEGGTAPTTTPTVFTDQIFNLMVRDAAGTPSVWANGRADDIRIYNRAISLAEITSIMSGGGQVSNTPYSASWNGQTTIAPSQNAVFDAFGTEINYPLTVYGAGTAYALTNTAAAIDFGTTDPTKVIDKAGTYMIFGQVHLSYNGATVVAETATVKVRRTNNTAADVSQVVVIDLPVSTTATNSYGTVTIPPFVYTTTNTDDSLSVFGNVSAALGAGAIDATAVGTSLVALKIY